MTEFLIVGIEHEMEGPSPTSNASTLMSAGCIERFKEKVVPRMRERTLILMESLSVKGLVTPTNVLHSKISARVFKGALGSLLPTFGGCDPRIGPDKDDRVTGQMYDTWMEVCGRLMTIRQEHDVKVDSLDQAVTLARIGTTPLGIRRAPSSHEVELARWIGVMSRKFDRLYLDMMEKLGPRFDTCILVCGAVHALSLAVSTGYETLDLVSHEDATETYFYYLGDYHWSRQLIEYKS